MIFFVAAGTLLIAAAIAYRKQLSELYNLAKVVAEHSSAGTSPGVCEENEEENKDFALAWYHAGAKAVLDFQVKSVIVTDLTIEQRFNEEWAELGDDDESAAQE